MRSIIKINSQYNKYKNIHNYTSRYYDYIYSIFLYIFVFAICCTLNIYKIPVIQRSIEICLKWKLCEKVNSSKMLSVHNQKLAVHHCRKSVVPTNVMSIKVELQQLEHKYLLTVSSFYRWFWKLLDRHPIKTLDLIFYWIHSQLQYWSIILDRIFTWLVTIV